MQRSVNAAVGSSGQASELDSPARYCENRKYSVNPRFCGVRWQSESASGDTALAESDGCELRGCTFAKSQSGVATSFCRRTPYNAALPNVYIEVTPNLPRIEVNLTRSNPLRVRALDQAGQPIPGVIARVDEW